jgi:diguanylate cyclase (GGDEF)-like protein
VLVAFAEALRAAVRKIDSVIRYGGDEFLVVLPETDDEGADVAAERIRSAVVAALPDSDAFPADIRISVSAGVAVHHPGDDLGAKLREADSAMYEDKRRRQENRASK